MLIIYGCMKEQTKVSDEVTVSVINQCRATIYLYDNGSESNI